MGRPLGAKNKTPREIRAEGAARIKESKLKERIEAKNRQIEELKRKKASSK